MHPVVWGLRLFALLPLFLFGAFSLFCAAKGVELARLADGLGPALMFGGLALASTLAYPLLIDLQIRLARPDVPSQPLPLVACDLFFLGGALYASWRLSAGGFAGIPLIGIAVALWVVAAAVARRRMVGAPATAPAVTPPEPSKKKRDGTSRSRRTRRTRS